MMGASMTYSGSRAQVTGDQPGLITVFYMGLWSRPIRTWQTNPFRQARPGQLPIRASKI